MYFLKILKLSGIKETKVHQKQMPILLSEVDTHLEKGAIEIVPKKIILQHIFLGTKEKWRNETSNQFKTSQQVHG